MQKKTPKRTSQKPIRWSTVTMIMLFVASFWLFAKAEAAPVKCKALVENVGTVTGVGATKTEAFEDAAVQCFEKSSKNFRRKSGFDLDMDSGLDAIDVCANIKCST